MKGLGGLTDVRADVEYRFHEVQRNDLGQVASEIAAARWRRRKPPPGTMDCPPPQRRRPAHRLHRSASSDPRWRNMRAKRKCHTTMYGSSTGNTSQFRAV